MDISFHGLTVRPGDTLVLLAKDPLTQQQVDTLTSEIRSQLPISSRVMILDGFTQLGVILGREV